MSPTKENSNRLARIRSHDETKEGFKSQIRRKDERSQGEEESRRRGFQFLD